jgi:selenocysteine lyase/cysteine desulfurase
MRSTLPTSWGLPPLPSSGPVLPRGPHNPLDESAFERNFNFIGSGNFSPYLCVPAAFAYRAALGGEDVIRAYCEALARDGGARVAAALGTEVLDNATRTHSRCFFANVRLPISPAACEATRAASTAVPPLPKERLPGAVRAWIERASARDHDAFMAAFEFRAAWWVRLSAAVYLDLADFDAAAAILKDLCRRAESGEWLADYHRQQSQLSPANGGKS